MHTLVHTCMECTVHACVSSCINMVTSSFVSHMHGLCRCAYVRMYVHMYVLVCDMYLKVTTTFAFLVTA